MDAGLRAMTVRMVEVVSVDTLTDADENVDFFLERWWGNVATLVSGILKI